MKKLVVILLVACMALALAACGGGSNGAAPATSQPAAPAPAATATGESAAPSPTASTYQCASDATPVTFWGWSAGYDLAVNEFNATHPDICVTIENAGAAGDEYTKLSDTLKAGTGAPDVAQIEYFELPSFTITNSLEDLSQYGVGAAQANVIPAAWSQVTQGSAIYAMPVDVGPLALWYNQDQLTAAGITAAPTTWDEFATAADQLKAKDSNAAITNFDPETAQLVLALMQAWGAFPFTYTGGDTLGIDFTGAAQTAFAQYWQGLIDKKEVTTAAEFSPEQWSNLDSGKNAARISPAWGPVGMQLSIKDTIGSWRAAQLPQVKAGDALSGSWGGSTVAVIKGSPHASQAAEFAQWFGGSDDSWKILAGPIGGAFPAYLPLLNDSTFLATTLPISGDQPLNTVFAQAAKNITYGQWPPIMTAALTQWTSTFAGVVNGSQTLQQAFATYQQQLVSYAQSQGFTVTTD
ncbi:MAG: extracellular solute-binding protein [Micrococcales bacterium]|nr:extracellular solute-binding protein [Micrococcales bacterium]